MNTNVLRAVLIRNFVSYFANPTGYLFIWFFVALSSSFAFWPDEFFNANLANLNQLNGVFPFIMLLFIPAITMSIWAEERREGTDELLLTVPASDFDIVLGKYLAAVAIFTVSLLFSLVSNFLVLSWLGGPDVGLFLATYFGYWMIGLAMLAIGMVASFCTSNLTIAYLLGALFNAPLVSLVRADSVLGQAWGTPLQQWSIGGQFRDFGRGIIPFSGLVYFGAIVVVMLYLSMVLIGRRHWVRGGDWLLLGLHYAVRTVALLVIGFGAVFVFYYHDVRGDATSEQLSALSEHTESLLSDVKKTLDKEEPRRVVEVNAYVSPNVPESYVQSRLNLLTKLREIEARGGGVVRVTIHQPERFSQQAANAKERFGIEPRRVTTNTRGAMTQEFVFMGVAFTCGLEKQILPFIDRGIPAEYALIQSICAVTQQKRKRIGILQTDAQLYGSFNMQTMSPGRNWPIVDELEKQYEVVRINPASPIPERKAAGGEDEQEEGVDVLLAVQPSSLGPEEMKNFLDAVRRGQPTAVFEDPFTYFAGSVPATTAPRRPQNSQMAMMMRQPPPQKGDIKPLWRMLGVSFSGDNGVDVPYLNPRDAGQADQIVWQRYNPYPKMSEFPMEFVFVDSGCGAETPVNQEHDISSKLQQVLFPMPGWIEKRQASRMEFTPLIRTGPISGYVRYGDLTLPSIFGMMLNPNPLRSVGDGMGYVLAAHVTGSPLPERDAGLDPHDDEEKAKPGKVNVVLVSDIDMLHEAFFRLREVGEVQGLGVHFDFDNVTFILNALDALAGDVRFLELRKRRPQHHRLTRIDYVTEKARQETDKQREQAQKDFDKATEEREEALDKAMKKLEKEIKSQQNIDPLEIQQRVRIARNKEEKELKRTRDELEQERDAKIEEIEAKLAINVRQWQNRYKSLAVWLPPIPPLFLALLVFLVRRAREKEGIAKSRMR